MKIILNKCWGGPSLSNEAMKILGYPIHEEFEAGGRLILDKEGGRTNPKIIKVIEELGERANGHRAHLKVVEIPDNCSYRISEYDGIETVIYSTIPNYSSIIEEEVSLTRSMIEEAIYQRNKHGDPIESDSMNEHLDALERDLLRMIKDDKPTMERK